jgi:anthranilate phosphoribosyltransferase
VRLADAIARGLARQHLTADEMAAVVGAIMDGEATAAQIGGLLIALRMKGETADELAGAARAMRARATKIACPEAHRAVDTCGTGGDGSNTVNVSTLSAIVVAGAGVRVAKHGNRAQSSRSGSADVLTALGVKIDVPVAVTERSLVEVGIGFMFAPQFHAATRHVAGARKELGTRTVFNLLGPLTNPAGVGRQVVGVFDPSWVVPMAEALGSLGSERVFVVHGEGGLDECAVAGRTFVAEHVRGTTRSFHVTPADFGLAEADPAGLRGGDAEENAGILRATLDGTPGAVRTAAVMEAALALVAADAAESLEAGARAAERSIDSGKARETLDRWAALTQATE